MERFTCPVCGKVLAGKDLPDPESIKDDFSELRSTRILKAFLEFDFTHAEALESHWLTALMKVECDTQGICTHVEISEIKVRNVEGL